MIQLTLGNFLEEFINNREVRDCLIKARHPHKGMDEDGYTYLDYVNFKLRQYKQRPLKHVVAEVNLLLRGGDIGTLPYSEDKKPL